MDAGDPVFFIPCPACDGSGASEDAVCCGASEGACCGNPVIQQSPCCPCEGRGLMSRAQFLNHALILGDSRLLAQHEAIELIEALGPGALGALRRRL